MSRKIPKQDANLILTDTKRFPTASTQCNASCAFYAFCGNSRDYEPCRGFVLINGESARMLKRNLDSHALEYIKNSYDMGQRSLQTGDMATVACITRDIYHLNELVASQKDKKFTIRGFNVYVVEPDGSLSLPEQLPEEKKVELPPHPQTRAVDLNLTTQTNARKYPDVCSSACDYSRVCPYFPKNVGQTCVNRHDLLTNEKVFRK